MKTLISALLILSVGLSGQVVLNPTPSRELGQATLAVKTFAPNLVEGKELSGPNGIAVDTSTSPPILYVADTGNNRVLAWRNATTFANGAFADLVIGQPDMQTTTAGGPLNLAGPAGLVVDRNGNLFVADSGHNRILRYSASDLQAAFKQQTLISPTLVLGQTSLSPTATGPNQGGISASTLSLGVNLGLGGLALDSQGVTCAASAGPCLWIADVANHRVLRYPASVITGTNPGPADLVLGEIDFATVKPADSPYRLDALNAPSSVAFDSKGRLFVTDYYNRVVVYEPPFASGKTATRVIAGSNNLLPVQGGSNDQNLTSPQGVVVINDVPLVLDSINSRIMRYAPYDQWPVTSLTIPTTPVQFMLTPPVANFVIAQDTFAGKKPNDGLVEASATTLFLPTQATFAGGEFYVADNGNNRVLVFGDPTVVPNPVPFRARRLLGQMDYPYGQPNLIEGRELFLNGGNVTGGGIAVDTASNPPHLYIADTGNNRVLGYRDVRTAGVDCCHPGTPVAKADLVIGQPDFMRAVPNYPSGNLTTVTPNDSGLSSPLAVAVDSSGDLWVADIGNGRVVRFPRPFDQAQGSQQHANLVIGQTGFTTAVFQPTQQIMSGPSGLAFSAEGHLWVSDLIDNRVLLFKKPSTGFTSGMAASNVFGQPDFTTRSRKDITDPTSPKRLNAPRGMATDGSRLYLCDTGNNRILIYDQATTAGNDPTPSPSILTYGLNAPFGIFVNPVLGEIWVASTNAGLVQRYPSFDNLPTTNFQPNFTVNSNGPLSIALDSFGNLIASETINRIALYYPSIKSVVNAANYQARPIAPGEIVTLFSDTGLFSDATAAFSSLPVPTVLADTQVLVNGTPSPLFYVSPGQINFVTPMGMPSNGAVEVQVIKQSQSQIKAVSTQQAADSSPALFTADASGLGQLAVINEDGTVNGTANPVQRGHFITLFGTGQGSVPNAPPDGVAPAGAVPTTSNPVVYVSGLPIDASNLQYSGLAPGLVGVWQVNVKIPDTVAPGVQPLLLQYKGTFTGGTGQRTTIVVRQ